MANSILIVLHSIEKEPNWLHHKKAFLISWCNLKSHFSYPKFLEPRFLDPFVSIAKKSPYTELKSNPAKKWLEMSTRFGFLYLPKSSSLDWELMLRKFVFESYYFLCPIFLNFCKPMVNGTSLEIGIRVAEISFSRF